MAEQTARRTWLKRGLIVGAVAVGLIVLLLLWFFDSSQLDEEIAALRSQGLPTNAAELNTYYSVPPDVADTTELWTAASAAVAAAGIEHRAAKIPIVGMGPTPVPAPGKEWLELDVSRTFLNELDDEIQLIMRAADAGGMARYPVDFTLGTSALLPGQKEPRVMARLLTLRAHVHAHDAQDSEALRDVTAIFAVSDSVRGEPTLISQLVRIATHAIGCQLTADLLPHCKWTDAELENLQTAIGKARFREEMLTAFHGELAWCLTTLDTSPGILFRDSHKLKAIELFGESTKGLGASWQEATKRNQKIDSELKAISGSMISRMKYMFVMMTMPALQQSVTAGPRAEARQNCAINTIAAHRFRLRHGVLPASLAELRDLIPGDASEKSSRLTDPFDGQALKFKCDAGHLRIYSIADNQVDDGGDFASKKRHEGDLGYSIVQ